MKRLFIAIRIEPENEFLRMISEFKEVLKNERIKWTENSNIHITLLFLGDTGEKRVYEIDHTLKQIASGFNGFNLVLSGAGIFRSLKDPRVLWTGMLPSVEMARLNRLISEKMAETGIKPEEKAFNPHITIGRIKSINDIPGLANLVEKYRDKVIQRIVVRGIILYESILGPGGPVYKPLGKYLLSGL